MAKPFQSARVARQSAGMKHQLKLGGRTRGNQAALDSLAMDGLLGCFLLPALCARRAVTEPKLGAALHLAARPRLHCTYDKFNRDTQNYHEEPSRFPRRVPVTKSLTEFSPAFD